MLQVLPYCSKAPKGVLSNWKKKPTKVVGVNIDQRRSHTYRDCRLQIYGKWINIVINSKWIETTSNIKKK